MAYQRPPLPGNPCKWSQTATHRIYDQLGIKGKVIPKTMHGRFRVDGHTIIIKRPGKNAGGGVPRMFIDFGGKELPIGRVYQALCRPYKHRQKRNNAARRARRAQGR